MGMTLGSIFQEGFRPDLSRSWAPLGLQGLRGQIGDAALAAPWRMIFECESDGCTVRDADPDGTRCRRLIELGYDLVFPMVAIPLGHLRRACPTWRADRRVQPLGVAPFLFPEFHDVWPKHVEILQSIFGVPKIYALCPRIELWDKPFDDWSDEDWKTCGRSALWEVTTGRVLWADGAHPIEKMPEIGCPAPKYFKFGLLKKRLRAKKNRSDPSWLNEAHHEPTAVYREIERMMSQLEAGPSSVGRGKPDTDPGTGPDPPPAPSRIPPMTSSWNGKLPRQERSSQTGNHGTTPPYGRGSPP